MRKVFFIVCLLFLSASVSMAQGKISNSWSCPKPTVQTVNVPDEPNHSYSIAQPSCTATKGSIEGVKDKSGVAAEFHEVNGTTFNWHGRFVVTMENGDKVFYAYSGSGSTDISKSLSNKWTLSNGTGKFKGIKGSGICAGKRAADGNATWDCTGSYTMGK